MKKGRHAGDAANPLSVANHRAALESLHGFEPNARASVRSTYGDTSPSELAVRVGVQVREPKLLELRFGRSESTFDYFQFFELMRRMTLAVRPQLA